MVHCTLRISFHFITQNQSRHSSLTPHYNSIKISTYIEGAKYITGSIFKSLQILYKYIFVIFCNFLRGGEPQMHSKQKLEIRQFWEDHIYICFRARARRARNQAENTLQGHILWRHSQYIVLDSLLITGICAD